MYCMFQQNIVRIRVNVRVKNRRLPKPAALRCLGFVGVLWWLFSKPTYYTINFAGYIKLNCSALGYIKQFKRTLLQQSDDRVSPKKFQTCRMTALSDLYPSFTTFSRINVT